MNHFRYFTNEKDSIRCSLCPKRCLLGPGEKGQCRVRFNRGGKLPCDSERGFAAKLDLPFYGFVTALAIDPIEKKPLYHFRPGTEIFSVGFTGCNLHCPFCQNWHISQETNVAGKVLSPAELIALAQQKTSSIAYTYSEPLVHIEFLIDCMKEARKAGIANVLVSNGCVNSEAAAEVLELTDAANIDLKCFSEETYSKVLGGDLATVLRFIKSACRKGVHVELTTLVVPGINDSAEELNACVDFIASLDSVVPWHLSAYHPDWKMKAPPTPPGFLLDFAAQARKRLSYVYTGNIPGEKSDSSCTNCGKIMINRRGFRTDTSALTLKEDKGKRSFFCVHCGEKAPVRYEKLS